MMQGQSCMIYAPPGEVVECGFSNGKMVDGRAKILVSDRIN